VAPSARRLRASACCDSVNFGGRPMRCPRFCAPLRLSAVRVRIRSRSTSANPPNTAIINRPVLVPVSAHGSASERNRALASTIRLMMANRSKALRARRSMHFCNNRRSFKQSQNNAASPHFYESSAPKSFLSIARAIHLIGGSHFSTFSCER